VSTQCSPVPCNFCRRQREALIKAAEVTADPALQKEIAKAIVDHDKQVRRWGVHPMCRWTPASRVEALIQVDPDK